VRHFLLDEMIDDDFCPIAFLHFHSCVANRRKLIQRAE
jgi:hypothetical protein